MGRQLKHEEIAELLGAYALDAVDADEAALVEAHLATCPRCRDEVRDHREVASLLAYSGAAAPAGLWDALAAALDEPDAPVAAPRLAPVTSIAEARASRSRTQSLVLGSAAAAVLVLVLAVGGLWWKLDKVTSRVDQAGSEQALQRAAEDASRTAGARKVQLTTPDNRVLADGVVRPDGTSFLWNVHLPELRSGRAYQLWAIVGDGEKRSVGVLGRSPHAVGFNVPTTSLVALAVTEEVATGVTATTQQAVVFGVVPA
jgi:anti-sigma-K factor RskA